MQNIFRRALPLLAVLALPLAARADEAKLILPDLGSVSFLGTSGRTLLEIGLIICALGLIFGSVIFTQLKKLPVHRSMLEVSELIYETCKTYLITQGKFILILEGFIGAIMVIYFGWLRHFEVAKVITILVFSLLGIGGSYGVAWFGIRVNTFANSRTAFASLMGKPFPTYAIPLKAGMSIGTLLVRIFAMRIMMIVASVGSYLINEIVQRGRFANADRMNFEAPLTFLVWLTSLVSVALTFVVSYLLIPNLGGDSSMWWKLSLIITAGTLAGAIIPEVVKVFTSVESAHVREVVTASREGGASLNVLSGLTAGNFSAYWMGIVIVALMGIGFFVSAQGLSQVMLAPAVFAFGLVAFGFLGMGPVTIAVDSYGPVTDNAQSVYELSIIEQLPGIEAEVKRDFGFDLSFDKAKHFLEENDGAGNTFKATAKPVLIGTAVVGATTMIFSIIMVLTDGLRTNMQYLTILHAPFLLGLITGGAVIYWFTGASIQAVSTGAYRAVEFIKANIKLEGATKASIADSKKVVEICTQYAQRGMWNIFLVVFFSTLAFACLESYYFIGYLISIALFGLYQAIFMANAGGAWDNAKKVVEVELKSKGTPLHAASVVGDTVGDPFKDTSSVAMNPIIKFTTLFGLLAVELATEMQTGTRLVLAAIFFAISVVFVWRSFYRMRIQAGVRATQTERAAARAA